MDVVTLEVHNYKLNMFVKIVNNKVREFINVTRSYWRWVGVKFMYREMKNLQNFV